MNRNILLTKLKNSKKQKELKKQFKENIIKKNKEDELKPLDFNKSNPDIVIKYQDDKNNRSKLIKPIKPKDNFDIIIEKKEDLTNLLHDRMEERKIEIKIEKKPIKKRIISQPITNFEEQKETINKLKQLMDEKIQKGKELTNAILSQYE